MKDLKAKENNKVTKLLKLLLPLALLVGCDTSEEVYDTSGFETIDNSELSGFYTSYGYYGEDVVFGEKTIVGTWVLYDTSSDSTLYTKFYDDDELLMGNGSKYNYGVSLSGLSINISTGETIVITTSNIHKQVDDLDCYRVNVVGTSSTSSADMCPDH